MNPLEFLAVVLPSPQHGLYCAAELSTVKKEHLFVAELNEIYPAGDNLISDNKNAYLALSTFVKAGKRTAANARYIRSFFIDMDGYASKKQAALALSAFLSATGLEQFGRPWIVGSGGGLHCYWPLQDDILIDDWKPIAENLKRLCKQEKLAIDMTVTADSARVLRIPGTVNFKEKYGEPRPVVLLSEGSIFDFDLLGEFITSKLTALPPVAVTPALSLLGERPKSLPTATAVKMFENSTTSFKKILNATKADTGCAQLQHYVENAAEEGMEPAWRGWLSIAKVCTDGDKAVRWLSKLHPYDEDRMHAKLAQIKGPYPCTKLESENPGLCHTCPHFGKITNPLALGREVALETEEKEIEVVLPSDSPSIPDEIVKVIRPTPPKGFAYGANGGIYMEKTDEDAAGNKVKRQILLLPFDLFVVDILNCQGVHTVHMMAVKPKEGVLQITLPQRAVVSKDETVKVLAEQNIIAAIGSGNDVNLFAYVRQCVEEASSGKAPIKVPSSYGWQEDDTFVYSGRIYSKKDPLTVPMKELQNQNAYTKPAGTIEGWRECINLLIRKKMYSHLAIMLAGASAPLMRFTGLYGMTYHCGSTESGTGKSLALEAAASIWGHPVRYRTGKGTSPVAMQQRLGLLGNIPLITDEITSKNRKDFEWFPEFLLDMTEGQGKERMESGSNKERLNLSTWMTVAIMSSNTHAVDSLTGGRKHAAEGELRRLLEFTWTEVLTWEPHEIEIIKSLQHNYGVAGHMMVDYMAKNVDLLKTMVPDCVRQVFKDFGATNDERFWVGGIGAALAAGILFNKTHAGIIELPMREIMNTFKECVESMRVNIKGSARTAEDVLNAYTRDNYGKMIVVRYDDALKRLITTLGEEREVDQSLTRSSIMGRVEHDVTPEHIDYYIEEGMLKAYCASMSFGYTDFKRQLADMFVVTHMPKKNMTSKTKGPQMRVAALKISRRKTTMQEDDEGSELIGGDGETADPLSVD